MRIYIYICDCLEGYAGISLLLASIAGLKMIS